MTFFTHGRMVLGLCFLGLLGISGCYKPLTLQEKAPHYLESRFFVDPDVRVYADFRRECHGQEEYLHKAVVDRLKEAGFQVVDDSSAAYDFRIHLQAEEEKKGDWLDQPVTGTDFVHPRELPYDHRLDDPYLMHTTHQYAYRVRTVLESDGRPALVVVSYSTIPDCTDFFGVVAADMANELIRALADTKPNHQTMEKQ